MYVPDASIEQGVLVWLNGQDLPHCHAGISFQEVLECFLRKCVGPALIVVPAAFVETVDLVDSCSMMSPVAELKVPWRDEPTQYHFYQLDAPAHHGGSSGG